MDYPFVALKIKNQVPSIDLHTDENTSKTLFKLDKGIDTLLAEIADLLDIPVESEDELFSLVNTGDETYLQFPDVEIDGESLTYDQLMAQVKDEMANFAPPAEVPAAVAGELALNHGADVLASFLDELYTLLLAKTVYTAAELGTDKIVLDDERAETRFIEKAIKELSQIEELEVELKNAPTTTKRKPKLIEMGDDVLLQIDRQTAEEIIRLSRATNFSVRDMTRWLTWLGRKSMGRSLIIQEGDRALKISLEDFKKISEKLDLN